mmetsp:Transcript_36114/g.61982  ORF Transcript_36114/g.61982 Transcript_36114/m.61982 type:complete len:240 (+) Transcript_36114:52-771(+)
MTRTTAAPRNKDLIPGVPRFSRAAMYGKRGNRKDRQWKPVQAKNDKAIAEPTPVVKDFNGGKRTILPKAPKWYPAEDLPSRRAVVKPAKKQQKLRSNIVPGSVLVLLSGHFAGRRVVFLKQLESGLLLVTGPYKINGCPLRRVNQAYVIATSTTVDISGVNVPENINDAYFKRPAQEKKGRFFDNKEEAKNVVSDQRKADQQSVDAAILAAVKNVSGLREYLGARFALTKGQFPHAMVF